MSVGVYIHAHVCTGLVQLMTQLLFDVLGPKWDLWQVPSDEPGVWPQSLLWCLVDVVWMVAHSRGQGQEWQAPRPAGL